VFLVTASGQKQQDKKESIMTIEVREQKDAKGELELLDGSVFCVEIRCASCCESRWIRKADANTVTECKPCHHRRTRKKTAENTKIRARRKAAEKKAEHAAALAAALAAKRAEIAARNGATEAATSAPAKEGAKAKAKAGK